jgi:ferric-dicitrate binding protein FerR (iron transport regulator)
MKKVITGNISLELLVGFIEETLDSTEKAIVMQWIGEDTENRKYFETFEKAWRNPHEICGLDKEVRDTDWKVIASAMQKEEMPSHNRSARIPRRWWLAAAGLSLLVGTSVAGYFIGLSQTAPAAGHHITYQEITVPKGEKSELTLSDGTRIWINADSHVRFPGQFSNESRDIWLNGEAYFEVTSDTKRPFLVHTSELDVRVYGTKFNLKAYPDEDVIETTLVEGIVSLQTRNAINHKKEEVFLKPNHKAIYLKKKAPAEIIEELEREIREPLKPKKILVSRTVRVEPDISWREGKLIFMEENFENIATKLERRYDVTINIENDQIKRVKYTGVLKNVSIEQALKAIQLTTDFDFRILEDSILISDKTPINLKEAN